MKTKISVVKNPRPARSSGAALVIILAFVVLMMGLVVAFFSRAITERQVSNSSANQTKADILARGALDLIVGDFKQEIANGSGTYTPPSATDPVYIPTSGTYVRPMRDTAVTALTGSNAIPNLLRVSGTANPPFPIATSGSASSVSSTVASANGRSIGLDRWNSHYFMPRSPTVTSSWGDSTPIDSVTSVIPTWVMVTNQGPQVLTSPTNTVIGRYAYAVYDESMVLDMNVAGFPASSGTTNIGGKGALSYADLTQLSGTTPSGNSFTITQNMVDNLVAWRNYATIKPTGTFGSYNLSGTTAAILATGTNYDAYIKSATNGFLVTAGGTYNNRTDQPFASRQQLLKFARAVNISPDALQYMGMFSRAVTAPSWIPTTPAASTSGTSTILYTSIANSGTGINPNLVKVTYQMTGAGNGTVTHYNDDGTSSTYGVKAGDPLIQRRFSLAKLLWIGHTGPDSTKFAPSVTLTQQKKAILDCFGLQYDSTHHCWNYSHAVGIGVDDPSARNPNDIQTLDQISKLTQPREPDLFELLKAGILQGSLGGDPGVGEITNTSANDQGVYGEDFELYSKEKDRHILQIGANMIDQADSDNYPTAIYNNMYTKYAEDDLYNCVFGTENLPVLTRVGLITDYMPDHTSPTYPSPDFEGFWLQPEIYNPNERTTADVVNYPDTPSYLRLVTYGSVLVQVTEGSNHNQSSSVITFSGGTVDTPAQAGVLCFVNTPPRQTTPPTYFDAPLMLEGFGSASVDYADHSAADASLSGTLNRYPPWKTTSWDSGLHHNYFLGIYLGQAGRDPATYPQHSCQVLIQQGTGGYLTFVLQYKDKFGNWLPYSCIARLTDIPANGWGSGSKTGSVGISTNVGHADGRTDRFSSQFSQIRAGQNPCWQAGSTLREAISSGTFVETGVGPGRADIFSGLPRAASGFVYPPPPIAHYLIDSWARNLTVSHDDNGANQQYNFYYKDPDGITRPGDAGWPDFTNTTQEKVFYDSTYSGEGDMLLHTAATGATASATRRRPVILNRPFLSVGELGYVFRDQPFKTLDFRTNASADMALLDLFNTTDQPAIVAGQISPAAQAPVLQAVLGGAMKQYATLSPVASAAVFSGSDSNAVATAVAAEVSGTNGPLANRADLVSRLAVPVYNTLTGSSANPYTYFNKTYGETAIRALVPVTNTRTWNLMIDVIAQSGRMSSNAASLKDFVVEGEKRYWLHVAIDRYTGKVVDQQMEPVYE